MSGGELILYTAEDGSAAIQLRAEGGTVWLTQAQIATLFDTTPQNITQHTKAIYAEGELTEAATCKELLQVRQEGCRAVNRSLKHYNLDMILAVGYRARSPRGTQFRQWATTHLREYLVKGFVLDDARLKEPGGWDYFDELLARIRDIRSSEKLFWRKVLDIYATSIDYDGNAETSKRFFATVQNKMHWAAHGHTAPEIVHHRADAGLPDMGMTSFKGGKPTRVEAAVAKNYLSAAELDTLNRIVNLYLEFAELQALNRKPMAMRDWIAKLDDFLRISERDILTHAGTVSHEQALKKAQLEFDKYRQTLINAKSPVEEHFDAAVKQVKVLARSKPVPKKGGE